MKIGWSSELSDQNLVTNPQYYKDRQNRSSLLSISMAIADDLGYSPEYYIYRDKAVVQPLYKQTVKILIVFVYVSFLVFHVRVSGNFFKTVYTICTTLFKIYYFFIK